MRAPHPAIPPAPEPSRRVFDPFNSSSTGHQRADNRLAGSTSWRQSRTAKLGHQFRSGDSGGKRVADTVGAGSSDFGRDGRKENGGWQKGAVGLRKAAMIANGSKAELHTQKGAVGLREAGWMGIGAMIAGGSEAELNTQKDAVRKRKEADEPSVRQLEEQEQEPQTKKPDKGIFRDLCIYVNGSTAPAIGDHKLKHLVAEHGARVSIALGRRSVTHVIIGKPNGKEGGAGGGLAGSKIQKEIQRVGGKGIKFVGVEWVIDSVKAGKRLPEARYPGLSLAPKGVKSVYGLFNKKRETPDVTDTKDGK